MRLFILAAALALGACASQPAPPTLAGSGAASGIVLFGTLAPAGSFEWQAAPAYTALAALRHRAARELRRGRIDAGTARETQRRADAVRRDLDSALAIERAGDRTMAGALLAAAARALKDAETYLEGSVK